MQGRIVTLGDDLSPKRDSHIIKLTSVNLLLWGLKRTASLCGTVERNEKESLSGEAWKEKKWVQTGTIGGQEEKK